MGGLEGGRNCRQFVCCRRQSNKSKRRTIVSGTPAPSQHGEQGNVERAKVKVLWKGLRDQSEPLTLAKNCIYASIGVHYRS